MWAGGGLGAALVALTTGEVWEFRNAWIVGGQQVHLRLDAVSALFLALLSLIGGAGAVYGREYWTERAHPRSASLGPRCGGACCCCASGLVLRHDQRAAFSHRVGVVHASRRTFS